MRINPISPSLIPMNRTMPLRSQAPLQRSGALAETQLENIHLRVYSLRTLIGKHTGLETVFTKKIKELNEQISELLARLEGYPLSSL